MSNKNKQDQNKKKNLEKDLNLNIKGTLNDVLKVSVPKDEKKKDDN